MCELFCGCAYACAGAGTLTNAKAIFSSPIFVPVYSVNIVQKLMQVHMSAFSQ